MLAAVVSRRHKLSLCLSELCMSFTKAPCLGRFAFPCLSGTAVSVFRPVMCPQCARSLPPKLSLINYYTLFLPRGKVRPADKLQLKAATILPLLDLPDPSKTQLPVGTVLSICTAPQIPAAIVLYNARRRGELAWLCCRDELKNLYTKFTQDFPIVTIEDPFDQDDWDHTAAFTAEGVCQVLFPPSAAHPRSTEQPFWMSSTLLFQVDLIRGLGEGNVSVPQGAAADLESLSALARKTLLSQAFAST